MIHYFEGFKYRVDINGQVRIPKMHHFNLQKCWKLTSLSELNVYKAMFCLSHDIW